MEGNCPEDDSLRFGGEEAEEEEDEELLKKRISDHPLYGLLIETHLNCLKVCFRDIEEVGTTTALNQADHTKLNATIPTSSELDNFMEVYCIALEKLKEVMEKPVQETATFISAMYVQLNELSVNPKPSSPLELENSHELKT
uniref:Homeobox protein knotted-1-like 1 n=1 Tax=Davidia involucrata TaxID=16924 RepID=A0A5B7C8C5_DAVIN